MNLPSGSKLVTADPDVEKHLKDHFQCFENEGVLKITPGDFYISLQYAKMKDEAYNFPVNSSDVFVTSFLKTGSTWLQEVVWAILHNPNLDHPDSKKDSYSKTPWFETHAMLPKEKMPRVLVENIPEEMNLFQAFAFLEKPRVFKTHLLFTMQNPDVLNKAKVVYVIRDPRDTCLSYFHFVSGVRLYGYSKSLETFVDDFIAGLLFCGSYLNHLRQWWAVKNKPNVYTVYYEKLKKNSREEVKKLGQFLEVDLQENQIDNIIHYTSFSEMKKRDIIETSAEAREQFLISDAKGFFRKGESGTAKSEMTTELRRKIAKHFRENLGEIKLPYDFNE